MIYSYSGKVQSDLGEIKYFIQDRVEELDSVILSREKLLDIKLIMSELIINSAIHGNHMDNCKCVYLDMSIKDHLMELYIKDEGTGIDYNIDQYDPEVLKDSGRGLVMVYGLSDEVVLRGDTVFVKIIV